MHVVKTFPPKNLFCKIFLLFSNYFYKILELTYFSCSSFSLLSVMLTTLLISWARWSGTPSGQSCGYWGSSGCGLQPMILFSLSRMHGRPALNPKKFSWVQLPCRRGYVRTESTVYSTRTPINSLWSTLQILFFLGCSTASFPQFSCGTFSRQSVSFL